MVHRDGSRRKRFGSSFFQPKRNAILSLPVALIRAQEVFIRTYATDAQIALRQVRDSSQLVRRLLKGEHSFIAGRLAAAFRAIGQPRIANDITGAITAAGYRVDELNPFASH